MNVIDLLGSIKSLTIKRDTLLNRENRLELLEFHWRTYLKTKKRHQEEEKKIVPALGAGSGNCVCGCE